MILFMARRYTRRLRFLSKAKVELSFGNSSYSYMWVPTESCLMLNLSHTHDRRTHANASR